MLATLFRSDRPQGFLVLPLLVIGLCTPLALTPWTPGTDSFMPLYLALVSLMSVHPILPAVLSGIWVAGTSMLLSTLANTVELFERRSRMPLFMLPVLLALWPAGMALDPVLAGMPAALLALRAIWYTAERTRSVQPYLDAGLWLGVASLFHMQFAFLVVAMWTSQSVLRPFSWRAYVVPVIGLALPLYLAWGTNTVMGSPWHPLGTLLNSVPGGPFPSALYVILGITVLSLLTLAAFAAYQRGYQRTILRGKNIRAAYLGVFFIMALMAVIGQLLSGSFSPAWVAVPASLLFSYPLLGQVRGWLSEVTAWVLLGLAFWAQWSAAAIFTA